MDHLRADGATFGSVVATLAPTYLEPQVTAGMTGGQVSINGSAVQLFVDQFVDRDHFGADARSRP
jgi:hypothetical protein